MGIGWNGHLVRYLGASINFLFQLHKHKLHWALSFVYHQCLESDFVCIVIAERSPRVPCRAPSPNRWEGEEFLGVNPKTAAFVPCAGNRSLRCCINVSPFSRSNCDGPNAGGGIINSKDSNNKLNPLLQSLFSLLGRAFPHWLPRA